MPSVIVQKFIDQCEEFITSQRDHLILWAVIFFAFGCAVYFALPFEPVPVTLYLSVFAVFILTSLVGFKASQSHHKLIYLLFLMCCAVTIITAGVTAGSLRTAYLSTPMLINTPQVLEIEGYVDEVERSPSSGWGVVTLKNIISHPLGKVRLTSRLKGNPLADLQLNDHVHVVVKLSPASKPAVFGAFDFQRYSFFEGLSAQGFMLKKPVTIDHSEPRFFSLEQYRKSIHEKIRAVLPENISGITNALMTGERADISDDDWNALRASGLAHIISISGLHVAMVAVPIFFIIRLFLVCIPYCALHWPTKKIAAFFALVACCAYVGFVVPSVPSTRALLMTGIALIAIILDRSPFSFRLIAFAAFIVLLFYPESIWSASFQLSFAAVTALIWVAEVTKPYWMKWRQDAGFITIFLLWLGASIMTSFVVAVVTSPFTSFHFQQIAVYSVVANALAIPITGVLVMPMMMVTFFALPFGFEHVPLTLMGLGVEWVMVVANMVESWPYAVWTTPSWSFTALCCFIFAGLILFLGLGRFRYVSIIFLTIACVFLVFTQSPVIHISQTGKQVVVSLDNKAIIANKRADKFMTSTALKYMDKADPIIIPREGRIDIDAQNKITCGGRACRYDLEFTKLTVGQNIGALIEDCAWADVIVTSEKFSNKSCRAEIFDLRTLRRTGAIAIYKDGNIKTVAQQQGDRPWTTNNGRGVWLSRKSVNDRSEQGMPIRPESARGQD